MQAEALPCVWPALQVNEFEEQPDVSFVCFLLMLCRQALLEGLLCCEEAHTACHGLVGDATNPHAVVSPLLEALPGRAACPACSRQSLCMTAEAAKKEKERQERARLEQERKRRDLRERALLGGQ